MKARKGGLSKHHLKELLGGALTVCMLDSTLDQKAFARLMAESKLYAEKRVATLRPNRRVLINHYALGRLIHRWQRSPLYLDEEGCPIPLRACGPAPSIEALFRDGKNSDYFRLGLKHLKQSGMLRKTRSGLFVPRTESLIIHTLKPELVGNLAQTINRLVSTVLKNTSLRRAKSIRLIERAAAVQNFPKSGVLAFKKFAREQGAGLVTTVYDWLETRRGKSHRTSRKEALTAGLHVFAFVEED